MFHTKTWSDYEEIKISKLKHEFHRDPTGSKLGQIIQIIYQNEAYRVKVTKKK